MFKFLKDKLKEAFSKFSKDVDQESKEVEETVKELEQEAPVQLKKKKPSEPVEESIIKEEDIEEEEINVPVDVEKEQSKEKEEPVEEITFEETEAEEQEIEQEAGQQAAKDIPDIDDEVLTELQLEQEEKEATFEEEKEEPKVKREEKQEGEKPRVRETPQKTPKTLPSAEEVIDIPPTPDEDEKVISMKDIEALKFKHEKKEEIKELKEEVKLPWKKPELPKIEPESVKPKEEKKGFFSRLKEKIIGKDKQENVEEEIEKGFIEDRTISDHDLEVQQLAQELEHEPQQIELPEEKPVEKVLEKKEVKKEQKKVEEIKEEIKKPKIDDDLEALKHEGYREVSLEEPKRKVRVPEEIGESKEDKRGFFAKIADVVTKTVLSEEKFEELFWELEVALMENNVALEVIDKIKGDLKVVLVNKKIQRGKSLEIIRKTLEHSIDDLFNVPSFDLVRAVRVKKPYIISFVGINGSGKTTTIAKIAYMLKINNISCVIAASDTFRAAAIQQLEEHAQKVGVKLIKHDYGADPAAVAFDAIKYAQAKGIDCVLIDTAGRLHSNTNLMDEMKKIMRVAKPELKIFIGEAITGNDCIEQAKQFNKAIGIDGIILCKADVDEKGGAAISVSYVTGKPILYLGTGQRYTDLLKFDKKIIMDTINF